MAAGIRFAVTNDWLNTRASLQQEITATALWVRLANDRWWNQICKYWVSGITGVICSQSKWQAFRADSMERKVIDCFEGWFDSRLLPIPTDHHPAFWLCNFTKKNSRNKKRKCKNPSDTNSVCRHKWQTWEFVLDFSCLFCGGAILLGITARGQKFSGNFSEIVFLYNLFSEMHFFSIQKLLLHRAMVMGT